MRIQASAVQMSAHQLLVEHYEKSEHLQTWIGQQPGGPPAGNAPSAKQDPVNLSGCCPKAAPAVAPAETVADDPAHPQLTILRLLLERLTGRRIVVANPKAAPPPASPPPTPATTQAKSAGESSAPAGWGMIYDYHEAYSRLEATSFQASGTFRTGDGREITFAVDLRMSQEFLRETDLHLRAGSALQDPLVLNFTGAPVELSPEKFAFDIDADGQSDSISFVTPGSGFLVLDRNRDGAVNDGSELFGPTSGDGYQELAAYDSDRNDWIDEADPIFRQLQLWSGETAASSQLRDLQTLGIGAIFLGRVATPFALNNAGNDLLGQVRESGIYAREDGSVGTMQQIDLVA